MSSKYRSMGVLGAPVAMTSDLAALEHNVLAKVARSESKIACRINTLALEFKRTRWMAGTLLALHTVTFLKIFLR